MISRFVLPIAAMLAALFVIVSILTSGANALSESMLYLAGFGIVVALFSPKAGLIFLFLTGNYIDVLKRLLVVGGNFGWQDVIRTLAVPPLVTSAVFCGIVIRLNKGQGVWPSWNRVILAGFLFILVSVASFLSGAELKEVAQSIANSALYAGFIAFAPSILTDIQKQHKLFRLLLLLFIPVIVYAWIQLNYGYNSIETEYARSGFTITTQPLLHPSEVEYKRIFSTMNSSNAYSFVGGILGVYALIFGFGPSLGRRIFGLFFAAACLGSQIPGAGRTSWIVVLITFLSYFLFSRRYLTLATYGVTTVATVVFLFNAEEVGKWLVENSASVAGNSDFSQRATNMGTFISRTSGISEWMNNKSMFSWFGLSKADITAYGTHDMIGQIYVTAGIMGLILSLLIGCYILFYLHKNLLGIRNPDDQKLASFYLANIFALLFAGVFSGSSLHIFPVNAYFWLMLGLLFQIIDSNKKAISAAARQTFHASLPQPASSL